MNNEDLDNVASEIYRSFCECGGIDSDELQKVWNEYQDAHGIIDYGSLPDRLVLAAIKFAVVNFAEKLEGNHEIIRSSNSN